MTFFRRPHDNVLLAVHVHVYRVHGVAEAREGGGGGVADGGEGGGGGHGRQGGQGGDDEYAALGQAADLAVPGII